ncbi:unnamed protein product [Rotaria sordida]|uniref:Uncharacterized protein n=1 Tax=Rotaria sordida TaxID=392033 RepID=A0A818NQF3_9BILA|nr:unnamed protein product [Rotaria sordida]
MDMATIAMCPAKAPMTTTPSPKLDDGICLSATWNRTGVIVAGLKGYGSALDRLKSPTGIFLDNNDVLYIADSVNHRVVKWMPGASSGQVVAGGNENGKNANQFNYLSSIVVDKNGTMFICDRENDRVQQWFANDSQGQTIIQNFSCWGVAMDKDESLYVSHFREHYVLKWPTNQVVAGGNGEGKNLDQLGYPSQIFVDQDHSVFVADSQNDRIIKWSIGAKEGIVVAGGNGIGDDANQFSRPAAVIVDDMGTVYVADNWNNRIVRWPKGATSGTVIVGGKNASDEMTKLSTPEHLTFDRHGNLYVADTGYHRILNDNSTCTFNSGSSSLQPSILTQAQSLRNQARQYQLEAKAASELSQVEYRFGCKSQAKVFIH